MDAHRMVTQPQLVVYVTSPLPFRGRTILGTDGYRAFERIASPSVRGAADAVRDGKAHAIVSTVGGVPSIGSVNRNTVPPPSRPSAMICPPCALTTA